ncbi:MAG TPA: SRPBCC family protein [Candidatus Limnocylindrales bacterium]
MDSRQSPGADAPAAGSRIAETAVRFEVTVNAPIERAFRVFTQGIDSWWPRDHHIGEAALAVAVIEPRTGGRWYELGVDGSECDWGTVLVWDPPNHVALSWHLDGDFRYDAQQSRASLVDVRFQARDDRTTLVTLEHSGLDHHGPSWPRLRDGISRGWPRDLERFAHAAETGSAGGTQSVT